MSVVIRNQLDAAKASMEQLLRVDHPQAMLCRDVDDLLVTLVNLVEHLNHRTDGWRSAIDKRELQYREEDAREIDHLYRTLEETFARASGLVDRMRKAGFEVDRTNAFQLAWKELRSVTCFSLDRVAAAAEQARTGQKRELGDFLNELFILAISVQKAPD